MELLLVKDELHEVVMQQKPTVIPTGWMAKDGKARATIGLALDNDQLCHVMGASTAYEMWEALKNYHERGSLTNKIYVFRKLCSLKLEEGGNMAEHLMSVAELVHRLIALGEGLQEHWIVAIILSSLPSSYDPLITALESRPVEELKQDYVKGKLLDEWKRKCESVDPDTALKVSAHGRNKFRVSGAQSGSNGNNDRKKKKCYCCKKLGHFWRDCPKLNVSDDDDDDEEEEEEEAKVSTVQSKMRRLTHDDRNVCFAATAGGKRREVEPAEDWCLDSACLMHLTGRAELLEGLVACKRKIVLADGREMFARGIGTGRLTVNRENGKQVIPIENVLFVPGLISNLLSVSCIVEKGFSVSFKTKECVIMKENDVIAVGKKNKGLYVVQ